MLFLQNLFAIFHYFPHVIISELIFFLINLFIYLGLHWVFVAARGLFSSCGERGLLTIAVHGLLIAVASLVAEHRF